MLENTELNLGSGFAWAYPRGVDADFQNLFRLMGNITLAEFIELVQTVEKVLQNDECGSKFRERFEILKTLPPTIIRRVLLHPVWIYWVRSTRQIVQAKIQSKEIPQEWRRHLNPPEKSHAGFLQESLDLFAQLVLAACILAQREIELPVKIYDNRFLCLPATGLAIDCADVPFSDRSPQFVSAEIKEIRKDDFILILKSSANDSTEFSYHLEKQTPNKSSLPTVSSTHRLEQLVLSESNRCEIDNRDPRIINNWVWFDVFPGKPMVSAAAESQIPLWQQNLSSAFTTLQKCCPLLAQELAYIWRTVIPVNVRQSKQSVSCSSRDFWGAIQVSPHLGIALSEVLAHEYRHNILNALLEADSIIDEQCTKEAIFYSPWRSDSRPLLGLLHGIYSFIEVVDFNLSYLDKTNGLTSQSDFAEKRIIINHCRLQIALNELEKHSEFTPFGRDFFQGMVKRVEQFEKDIIGLNPSFKQTQNQQIEKQYSDWLKHRGV